MHYPSTDEYEPSSITSKEYDHLRDHLEGLIEDIYETGSIDDLERHFEEVLFIVGFRLPSGEPKLMKKPETKLPTTQMLNAWVGFSRAYAEMECGSRKAEKVYE